MNIDSSIKSYLEELYDIPFDVSGNVRYNDYTFTIKPHNENEELFNLNVRIKDKLRLIIEVYPERHAGFSISDMSSATIEKKELFSEYAHQLIDKKAKIDFYLNDNLCDILCPTSWPTKWNSYKLRISKSPICAEDELFNAIEVVSSWSAIIVGMFLSLLHIELVDETKRYEGGLNQIVVNKYERDPVNRELCLMSNGYVCKICGFEFEKKYGIIGRNFIHVHHIVPVSKSINAYLINPVKDLIPVCPNCHAMLHKSDPPFLPEELREKIQNNGTKDN